MTLIKDFETLQKALLKPTQDGKTIALVPTMGALHAGHGSLIAKACELADFVVATVFVNPTQFGKNEDFSAYPRTLEADVKFATERGADIVYAPDASDIYQEGFTTSISAGKISTILCGKSRPGHFDGVATIVTKLLLRTMPHMALFGIKDYQQLCVIERVVRDLDIPVEIIPVVTMREEDGLAMSSRNAYLSADERETAPFLYETLNNVAREMKYSSVAEALAKGIADLTAQGFKVDYLELCNPDTLEPLQKFQDDARLLAAAWLGKTRLIDNIAV
jgi:pantoate--beta-alanine ligase